LQPIFVEALSDSSYQVYTSALDNLAGIGTSEILEQLKPFLEDENPYVKMSAANAILAIADRSGGTT